MDDRRWRRRERRWLLGMMAVTFLSIVGAAVESTPIWLAVMGLTLLVVGYLVWDWTAGKRDIAAEEDEKRARRDALGVPEWKPESERR